MFSDKNNPINQYLVKLSWMWTLIFLVPAVLVTPISLGWAWETTVSHLGRVAVGHVVWYSVTSLIVLLDDTVGECTETAISSARACVDKGHEWTGFDISGYVFLLSYCIFVITEEASSLRPAFWREFGGNGQTTESEWNVIITPSSNLPCQHWRPMGQFLC